MYVYTYIILYRVFALGRKRQIDGPGGFPEAGIGVCHTGNLGHCSLQLKRLGVADQSL